MPVEARKGGTSCRLTGFAQAALTPAIAPDVIERTAREAPSPADSKRTGAVAADLSAAAALAVSEQALITSAMRPAQVPGRPPRATRSARSRWMPTTRRAPRSSPSLKGTNVDALQLTFDRAAIEQARKLKAAHMPEHGWVTIVVGQDVADTIAADHVTAALKSARADAKRARDAANTPTRPRPPHRRTAKGALTAPPMRRRASSRRARSARPPRLSASAPRSSTSNSASRSSTRCRA